MAQQSFFVLLSLLCCPAVQGSVADLSDTLRAGLKDSSLSMPKLAGLLQEHLGHTSKSASPWKAQAEMFLGLLQNMGGQVPEKAANQTRHYVDEIIKLLTTSSDDIRTDAQTTKDNTQQDIDSQYGTLQSAENKAEKALTDTQAVDSDLADCYAHLKQIAANHSVHCGEKELPAACKKKNSTKVHTFDVADKDTWTCDFLSGSDPTKCTSATSPLKTDLTSKRDALRLAYQQWKAENKTCNDDLTAERTLCQNTNESKNTQTETCKGLYINASDHLCNFRDKIDEWNNSKSTLTATQARAKTLLPPKEKEWTDLNLIICMLKKFRDRTKMTFTDADYGSCETESKGLVWVGEINTKETETETLTSASKFNKADCLDFSFSGGLGEKYMGSTGSTVIFFTQPEVSFSYNTDGSSGCTSTGVHSKKKVCNAGFREKFKDQ